jgi:mono/diheme cytochrome c family protein
MLLLLAAAPCLAAGCGASRSTHSATIPRAGGSPVARGAVLYRDDGCSGCHSLNGTRLAGPSWKGLAGSRVTLTSGRRVIADDAYLTRHIVEPNALTVRGYPHGVMAQAIEALDLKHRPAEVRALVAFIDSLG